jgi:putative ABC transport system permease protein
VTGGDSEAAPGDIKASVVSRAARVPGVAKATGAVVAVGARAVGHNGKAVGGAGGAPQYGVNWNSGDPMISLREGRAPRANNEIVINAGLAKLGNFKVGEQVGVLTLEAKKMFTLVGISEYSGGRDSVGGEQMIAFTEPVAQQLMLGATGAPNWALPTRWTPARTWPRSSPTRSRRDCRSSPTSCWASRPSPSWSGCS